MKYIPEGCSVLREIEAIKQKESDTRLEFEYGVEVQYNPNLLKNLKKILLKITKAP